MATRTEKPTRDAIMDIVQKLPDEICDDLLSYLEDIDLYYDPEVLARIKRHKEQLAAGESISLGELRAKYKA